MNIKLTRIGLTVGLVGVIGVGATIAYLQDQTQSITNTFDLSNNIHVQISETDLSGSSERFIVDNQDGTQNYGKLLLGKSYTKDPRVDLIDSDEAYVFMSVEGMDSLLNADIGPGNLDNTRDFSVKFDENNILNPKWEKIKDLDGKENTKTKYDGIYVYKEGEKFKSLSNNDSTEALFNFIMINPNLTSVNQGAQNNLLSGLRFKAFAIQTSGINQDTASEAAIKALTK